MVCYKQETKSGLLNVNLIFNQSSHHSLLQIHFSLLFSKVNDPGETSIMMLEEQNKHKSHSCDIVTGFTFSKQRQMNSWCLPHDSSRYESAALLTLTLLFHCGLCVNFHQVCCAAYLLQLQLSEALGSRQEVTSGYFTK